MKILVTGAGGFIGHHLIKRLKKDGHWVRGVDIKNPEFELTYADEFLRLDLREYSNCLTASADMDEIYNLAADMGGIGYITAYLADIARNNILINVNMLEAAKVKKVKKFLFSSSACVYSQSKQHDASVTPLKESDAYPADPESGYGWEKLFAEQMCEYYRKDHGLDIRIVRFHNVYGPLGTYEGGREKAPAAVCRKIAVAIDGDEIEVWGDGQQTRSFMYIDDCIEGLIRLMSSVHQQPLNLGTDELISINGLFNKVGDIAKRPFSKKHDLTKPQGVRGRNSDNTKLREVLGWEPSICLDDGLRKTYEWIEYTILHRVSATKWDSEGGEQGLRLDFPITNQSLVYEVGGYRGEWAAQIAKKYNPTIHIFEPVADYYKELLERFKDNPRVKIFNYGLLDREDWKDIYLDGGRSSLYEEKPNCERVQLVDISTLTVPDVISINAEGAEYPLLQRMLETGWAQKCRHIQIQFHNVHTGVRDLRKKIRQALSKTHEEVFNYPFVWERWSLKTQ